MAIDNILTDSRYIIYGMCMHTCSNAGKPDLEIIASTVSRLVMFIVLLQTVLASKVVKFRVWFHLDRFLYFKVM